MSHSDSRERDNTDGGTPCALSQVALYFMELMLTCAIPMTHYNEGAWLNDAAGCVPFDPCMAARSPYECQQLTDTLPRIVCAYDELNATQVPWTFELSFFKWCWWWRWLLFSLFISVPFVSSFLSSGPFHSRATPLWTSAYIVRNTYW